MRRMQKLSFMSMTLSDYDKIDVSEMDVASVGPTVAKRMSRFVQIENNPTLPTNQWTIGRYIQTLGN